MNSQLRATIQLVAQFLILPLLWLMYQMWTDLGGIKVQIARLEGRLELHQQTSDGAKKLAEQMELLNQNLDCIKLPPKGNGNGRTR